MSISAALNAAKAGLQVTGLRAETVAQNVANASTPGYVRRSVIMAENLLGGQTDGVKSLGTERSGNLALTQERRGLASDVSQSGVLATTWQSIDQKLGDGSRLFQAYAGFQSALSELALTPESSAARSQVLDQGRSIASEFAGLSEMVASMRSEADREIATGVDIVNDALRRIEGLNGRISATNLATDQAAALMDERDRALDDIAEHMPIRTADRANGSIDVLTQEGVFLLSGKARLLSFDASRAFGPDQTVANGGLSGLSLGDNDLTPGASSYSAVSGGMFGALFRVRDQDAPGLGAKLDTLAADLIARTSADAIDPTKPAGDPGLFVDTSPDGGPGLAGRLGLNALIDPDQGGASWRLRDGLGAVAEGPPGNSAILNGLLGSLSAHRPVSENGIEGNFTARELVAHTASLAGQSRVRHESVLASTKAQLVLASEAEHSATGVDIDAQMQDLLFIEQAYAANARVIQVAADMLNRLMEI